MISAHDLLSLVLEHAQPLTPQREPVASDRLDLVLAEDVAADIDSPPFAKALMDGYAVRRADLATEQPLPLSQERLAGSAATEPLAPGTCARITTGAALPEGADVVVMQERARLEADGRIRFVDPQASTGQHILPRGREMAAGQVILPHGRRLRAVEFGLLAAVGRTSFLAYPRPRVGLICTGDEIIEPNRVPRPGQIRNTNGPMLSALAVRAGGLPKFIGIAKDEPTWLRSHISEAVSNHNVVVLTGGVSVGPRDLVPQILAELGVELLAHKVNLKPGKPLLFGRKGNSLVFGLPGNPVSAFVGFELFVRPAILALRGVADPRPTTAEAVLTTDFPYATDRPTYHPARLSRHGTQLQVTPVPWFGSADLRGLTAADALVLLPVGDQVHPAGVTLPVILTDA